MPIDMDTNFSSYISREMPIAPLAKDSSPLKQKFFKKRAEDHLFQMDRQNRIPTEINPLEKWHQDPGFELIWKNQISENNQFLINLKKEISQFIVEAEERWKNNEIGSDWYRTRYANQNAWEHFKKDYLAMGVLTQNNYAVNYTNFFKNNPHLLDGMHLTPEQAGQLAAQEGGREIFKAIEQARGPMMHVRSPSPSLTHPLVPEHWSALPTKSVDPSVWNSRELALDQINQNVNLALDKLKHGDPTPREKEEIIKQIFVWQKERFALVDQGLYATIDTGLPKFQEANRQNYLKPEDSIFTDPRNHTNRWDVSLGLFYDQPGLWTSTGPYAVNANHLGLTISAPVSFIDQPDLIMANNDSNNFTMGSVETVSQKAVQATGLMSSDLSLKLENGGSIDHYIVQGSPYNTALYQNATPHFSFGAGVNIQSIDIDGKNYAWSELQKMEALPASKTMTLHLNNGAKWKIYAAELLLLDLEKKGDDIVGLKGTQPYRGFVRTAAIPMNPDYTPMHADFESLLDQYAQVVTTKASASTTYAGYNFVYERVDMNGKSTLEEPLIILKYPAQNSLTSGPTTTDLVYETPNGPARGVVGSLLQFQVPIPEAQLIGDKPHFKPEQLAVLKGGLLAEMDQIVKGPEVSTQFLYTSGKILQKQATTLKYALKVLKESNLSDADIYKLTKPLADKLKHEMVQFLSDMPQWDPTWGSIVPASSSAEKLIVADDTPPEQMNDKIYLKVALTFNPKAQIGEMTTDPNNEFGAGFFNDKALQWGYVITSAAVLADYDLAFQTSSPFVDQKTKNGATVKEVINSIWRDIANPNAADPYFPQIRTYDSYSGHNIASGQTKYPDGRNQESNSEALNCFLGMILWAIATQQDELKNHASALAGMEAESAKIYYQIGDPEKSIYLPQFAHGNPGVANYFDEKMDKRTFFGAHPALSIGIECIPANANSSNFLHGPQFTKRASDYLIQAWDTIPSPWKSINLSLIARADPAKAEELWSTIKENEWDEGTSPYIVLANIWFQKTAQFIESLHYYLFVHRYMLD